jgi:hypothetical protein
MRCKHRRLVVPPAPAFNSDLYVVGATVIPVLFIALMLQGGVLGRYALWTKNLRSLMLGRIGLRAAKKAVRLAEAGNMAAAENAKEPPTLALWGALRVYDLLIFPATLVFVALGGGEISAVLAIDHRHATPSSTHS